MEKQFKFTTLAQAQKKYPDAIQAKLTHDPNCMTEANIIDIGESIGSKEKSLVLFYKIGKCVSRVIVSREAQIEYEKNNNTKIIKLRTMEENVKQTVEMTAEELAQFEAFKVEKAEKETKQRAKDDREAYKQLVDETLESTLEELIHISGDIRIVKKTALDNFKTVIEMKALVIPRKVEKEDEQRSHTFTNSEGNKRITLGVYVTDGYRDTVEDGIAIVKECIEALAQDKQTKALVKMVMRLLARDAKGTLKASRVMQLRKVAEESDNKRFLEGVQIIEESYQPAVSKQFIRAEVKDEIGAWISVPLGMTEA